MSQSDSLLKDRVRAFWQQNPCGTKFADAPPGSRRFYELVEEHRYKKEWHIPAAAGFAHSKDLNVLEIGCGLGTDGAQFAKAGAKYTGIDLTHAAVELSKRRFELFDLLGTFRVADAERLNFPNHSFDIVYSHGVLHHTPDTAAAVREIHRVLKPGGHFCFMEPHSGSLPDVIRKVWYRFDRFFSDNEAAIDISGLQRDFRESFKLRKVNYLGNIAFLLVLNSLIFRIPPKSKKLFAPLLMKLEPWVNKLQTKLTSCFVVTQWQKL